MRWLILFCATISMNVFSAEIDTATKKQDLTTFDTPLLLGDWYLVNPNPDSGEEDFRAIKLTLKSNYEFKIDIQKLDYSVDQWEGMYNANEDTIILGVNTSEPQVYGYQNNQHMLSLNGVTFTKGLSDRLAGAWSSAHLAGEDLAASNISQMDLILQPDFIFMFRVVDTAGVEKIEQGVYYTEGNNLVLLYENGEHDTTYRLESGQLMLGDENSGGMFAVLDRVPQ
ncbi:hypothetical protein HGP28_06495 [Vibrio sp. SM6]|uniref:WD40 repeat protein n=1 Tax=Vibrio agarilyticus TaxID=2726741 RepID=A0A7X8YGH2_9VIBR|nr:hypothetical protein [Vibrio agarilyticus]NLS12550.1 hypothetical protein [Vibrio agarilyticus]